MAETGRPLISHGSSDFGGMGGNVSLKYQVYSDDRTTDDAVAVRNFPSIPRIGTPYSFGGTIRRDYRARRIRPRFVSTLSNRGAIWEVEVFYDNSVGSDLRPAPTEGDPFNLSMTVERVKYVATHDLNGVRITNSAGEPILAEREILFPVFSMQRQEYRNPCHNTLRYMDKVNNRPMWGQPVGQVFMRKIAPATTVSYGDEAAVWTVSYEIAINIEGTGWQLDVLDAGRSQLSERTVTPGKPVVKLEPILNAAGVEMDSPQLLDGHGKLLPEGEEPHYLHYDQRYIIDLLELRLPNPFLF